MSENNQFRRQYQNIPSDNETPNAHSFPNNEIPSEEPIIIIPIRKEIQKVSKRQNRNQLMSRYVTVFLLGTVFGLLIFLLSTFLWAHFQLKTSIESKDTNRTCRKRLIGYFNGYLNRKVTEKQIETFTHIIFNNVKIQPNGTIEFRSDTNKLLFLDAKNKANVMKSDVNIMFSTDAYNFNSEIMSPVMADFEKRQTWINSITSFIVDYQIDGVELFYCWPNTEEDKENYMLFCQELKNNLKKMEHRLHRKSPYIISIYSPSYPNDNRMDLHEVLQCADFLNVETSNYYGSWQADSNLTGPISALYSSKGQNKLKSIDTTLNAYVCKTKMPSRLNIMIPFSGSVWKHVKEPVIATDEVYRTAESNINETDSLGIQWINLEKRGWNLSSASWHNDSMTPYIWDAINRQLLTFDNERSLREKMKYVIERNLGGVTIFQLDSDDDSNTLLNAVTSVDLCPETESGKDDIKYKCEDM